MNGTSIQNLIDSMINAAGVIGTTDLPVQTPDGGRTYWAMELMVAPEQQGR